MTWLKTEIENNRIPELKKSRLILVLLVGTNDIEGSTVSQLKILFNYLFSTIRRMNPKSIIMSCEVIPRPKDYFDSTLKLLDFNESIWAYCKERSGMFPIPTFHPFIVNGFPNLDLYRDNLHLNEWGVELLRQIISHHVAEILRCSHIPKSMNPAPFTIVRRKVKQSHKFNQ